MKRTRQRRATASSGRRQLPHDGGVRGELAYEALREAILAGGVRPNERLVEQELASRLKVSRTPVREALRKLAAEGLVVAAPRRGFVVAELQPEVVLETYAVREVLEGLAARVAAEHISELELLQLREEFDRMVKACEGDAIGELAERNVSFYMLVAKASRNALLHQMLSGLQNRLRLLRDSNFSVPGRKEAALEEQRTLLEAIAARDPDKAEQLARIHVRNARRVRLTRLSQAAGLQPGTQRAGDPRKTAARFARETGSIRSKDSWS